jgi:hypothetical protein
MSNILDRLSRAMKLGEYNDPVDALARGNRRWTEQGELWNGKASKPQPVSEPRVEFDFTSTEIVRVTRAAVPTPPAKKTQAGLMRGGVQKGDLKPEAISRFFEVNQTVRRDRGFAYRVIHAARSCVSADYDLWKGPTRQVTFLLG